MLLQDIYLQYKDVVNFNLVYINEAHAVDVWPIGLSAGTINYSHKTLNDRKSCADKFVKTFDFKIPTFLDNMSNEFENIFSVWPFKYFVIDYDVEINEFVFSYIPEPSDSEFDMIELLKFIKIY